MFNRMCFIGRLWVISIISTYSCYLQCISIKLAARVDIQGRYKLHISSSFTGVCYPGKYTGLEDVDVRRQPKQQQQRHHQQQ